MGFLDSLKKMFGGGSQDAPATDAPAEEAPVEQAPAEEAPQEQPQEGGGEEEPTQPMQ